MTVLSKGTDAFSHAFENYTDTVYRIAVHNCRSRSDAEDLTQEVFLKLLQSHKVFRDNEHLKAWLIRVTVNLCRNHNRNRKRETLAAEIEAPTHPQYESVLQAVQALPENQRNAIYLHYYEGYTAAEIGELLSAKTNTVLSWLRRGREALHDTIGGFDDEL